MAACLLATDGIVSSALHVGGGVAEGAFHPGAHLRGSVLHLPRHLLRPGTHHSGDLMNTSKRPASRAASYGRLRERTYLNATGSKFDHPKRY